MSKKKTIKELEAERDKAWDEFESVAQRANRLEDKAVALSRKVNRMKAAGGLS